MSSGGLRGTILSLLIQNVLPRRSLAVLDIILIKQTILNQYLEVEDSFFPGWQ